LQEVKIEGHWVSVRRKVKSKIAKKKTGRMALPGAHGLRERKRRQTRERLTRVAMALFLERGFEATTLDDIAAAADISRRSFFHYFASKEDVVFAWQEESTAALIAAVAARPANESMLTAAENAISAMVRQLEPGEAMAMAQLKRDNPALQARDQVKYEKLERALAAALGKRAGHKTERLQARLVAMIATGAMRIGGELWAAEGAREKPEALVKRTFAAIRAILD
jgi:AcrR family transcriptional regulator